MNWRPIKSAPKDELILLSCDENPEYPPYVCVGRWIDVPHTNEYLDAWEKGNRDAANLEAYAAWRECHPGIMEHDGAGRGRTWEPRSSILFHPIHWMPLPKSAHKRVKS